MSALAPQMRPRPLLAACGLLLLLTLGGCTGANDEAPTDAVDTDITSCVPVPLPEEATLPSGVADALQEALEAALQANGAPGAAVAVRVPGQGVWVGVSGLEEVATQTPMDDGFALAWGSITKTAVAALFLRLADAGEVSLDDTVDTWFADLPGAETIRIRDLLAHTSGLHNFTAMPAFFQMLAAQDATGWTPRGIVELAADEGLDFEPGTGWSYSNTNFHALGLIAEAVTGDPLSRVLQDRVREPAGLGRTWLRGFEDPSVCAPLATGHLGGEPAFPLDPAWQWAAGGFFSDVRDLLRWGLVLFEDPAFTSVIDRMAVPAAIAGRDDPAPYGMGLYLSSNACGPIRGHTGSTMGYQSDLFRTDDGIVVAVLQNDFVREATSIAEGLCVAARSEILP